MPVYESYKTGPVSSTPAGVILSIEFGAGPFGVGESSKCDDSSATNGRSSTAQTGDNKVRASVTLSIFDDAPVQGVMSIALKAKANPTGTVLENYTAVKQVTGTVPIAEMLDNTAHPWTTSLYDPITHTGIGSRDRIKLGDAYVRLSQTVKGPADAAFHLTPGPTVNRGDSVDFKLQPTLNAGINTTYTSPVVVEDCLNEDVALVTASPAPSYSGPFAGAPSNVNGLALPQVTCAPTEAYVLWDLGQAQINSVIPPITYTVKAKLTARPGTKLSTAVVSTTNDSSTLAQRTAVNQMTIISIATFQIEKSALTPLVDVNRVGETNVDPLEWQVDLADLTSGEALRDMLAIDVLPFVGAGPYAGSSLPNDNSFTGTLAFDSVFGIVDHADPGGGPITIEYTSAPSAQIVLDPNDATNGVSGSTT
jgi:hypothetical protein